MNLSRIIIVLSHVPILLTVAIAAVCFKGLDRELRVFSYYIFLSGAIQSASLCLWSLQENNMPLLHLYVLLEFVFLARFYATLLGSFINVKIIWSMAVLFSVFTVSNSLFVQGIHSFNSNALTVESILVIILALFTFTVSMDSIVRQVGTRRNTTSLNWINSGLFIYHSCTLLLFFFGERITTVLSTNSNLYTWMLHSFLSAAMYTCFFISLWKQSRTRIF